MGGPSVLPGATGPLVGEASAKAGHRRSPQEPQQKADSPEPLSLSLAPSQRPKGHLGGNRPFRRGRVVGVGRCPVPPGL